ncbi:MAG: ABC transporter substrate-binding protein [Bacilli bacterium]|nr:ABC transporter substrate-binding protein [Bacilli bacterium]
MAFVKKALLLVPTLLMTSPLLFSCTQNDPNVSYLRVLNSEDYIAEGMTEAFEKKMLDEKGQRVKVIYETFDTMENMFNTLKTGKTKYDLVCASDYMVQKLVNLDLLEKMDYKYIPNYDTNASKFIRNRLKSITWGNNYNLDDYSMCYMWGTFGLLYNPNFYLFKERKIDAKEMIDKDMRTFDSLWDTRFQKTISVKDSMRDTYAVGLIHSNGEFFKDKSKTIEERQTVFNYGGEDDSNANEHINAVKNDLLKLRDNIFGFEVDSGKEDIVTEKIGIDTAWSGDAVKAINNAESEKNLMLYYSIPDEGSNLWFDCWTLQKNANKELAYQFLDFLSDSKNAIENIKAIGYTSSIASEDVFNYYNDIYAPTSSNSATTYPVSYFFGEGKELTIDTKYENRQIVAQFPKEEVTDSLMVMKDYGKNNDLILKMWEEVKHESLPTWAIVLFVVEIAIIITAITMVVVLRFRNKKQRKERKIKTA